MRESILSRISLFAFGRGIRESRLEAAIDQLEGQLEPAKDAQALYEDDWLSFVEDNLTKAREHLDVQLNAAWMYFHAARRAAFRRLSNTELASVVECFRAEGKQKLSDWRKACFVSLVGEDEFDPDDVDAAIYARKILDEHFENEYRRMAIVRQQIRYATAALVGSLLALAALIVIAHCWGHVLGTTDLLSNTVTSSASIQINEAYELLMHFLGGQPLQAVLPLTVIFVLGSFGGALTTLLSLLRGENRSFPDELLQSEVTVARPIIGGASALIVYFTLSAGLLGMNTQSTAAVFAIAIASGFSETLATGALKRIAKSRE
jgi:hypothetical protein